MQQWHIESDIIALAMLAIIGLAMRGYFDKKKNRDLRFLVCVWSGVIATIVEIFSSLVFDYAASSLSFHFWQTLYHLTDILSIITLYHYLVAVIFEDKPEFIHRSDIISLITYGVYVIFVISNLWFGHIYTYSQGSGYARGPLFLANLGLFACYSLFIFFFTLVKGRRVAEKRLLYILISLPAVLTAGIVLQLTISGWLTIMPCYSLGMLLTFLTIQQNRNDILFNDLSAAATHDTLTGICNRDYAEKQISSQLANRKAHSFAMLILDIDNFKYVNDTFGHEAGDRVLKQIGKYLAGYFRDSDIVARYGGDEFLIFMEYLADEEILRSRVSHLILDISRMKNPEYPKAAISCSIGVAHGRSGFTDFQTLLRQADTALYTVKRSGKNDFAFFHPEMTASEYHHTRVDTLTLKHADWFDADELKRMLYAFSSFMPYLASVNLSENTYYTMEIQTDLADTLPVYGTYSEFLEKAVSVFHPDERQMLLTSFSHESLLRAYASQSPIKREARHKNQAGVYRWSQIICLLSPPDGKAYAYLIVRPYEDAHNEALERYGLQKVFELAIQKAFEYIFVLTPADGLYRMYGSDGKNSHGLPDKGLYADAVCTVRDTLIPVNEQKEYYQHAVLENVIAEMDRNGGSYVFAYSVKGRLREVAYYDYEPSHAGILMTVQRK